MGSARLAWLLVVCGTLFALLSGQSDNKTPREIDAGGVSVTRAGVKRATLAVGDDKSVMLVLSNAEGVMRALLGVDARGRPVFSVRPSDGHGGAAIDCMRGGAALTLLDQGEQVRISMSVTKDGSEIDLLGPKGVIQASFSSNDDGTRSLEMRDSNGRPRLVLTVGKDGTPSIVFRDAAGRVTWSAQ